MSDPNPYATPSEQTLTDAGAELSPPQTVSVHTLEEDHLAAAAYNARNSPEMNAVHRRPRIMFTIVGVLALAMGLLMLAETAVAFVYILLGLGFLLGALMFPRVAARMIKANVRTLIKQDVITLDDDPSLITLDTWGVALDTTLVKTRISWQKIKRVRWNDDYLFLFYQSHMPIALPLRAFASEQRFHAFCRLAQSLWEGHHKAAN
ncbi:hypothetical protein Pla123a_01050 [Posidoniimonas polymericola]|uniref:YcxB-like C-terminal domain-containing protein n=1 Tax=Posidoniimonas polymericola TaxID=2528002 RepID=A0A5C5ZDQ2_9BACT|nr:YcxB family protein [Posidoniimonas polymericola]TWT85298.1 hypothetical protein Pla123a_01050 [Posidoniimonas polymericola]